ncbi:MAG: deoxyribose-phosphate aldolase [Actinomycetota bacterium]
MTVDQIDRRAVAARTLPLIDLTSLGDDDDEAIVDRLLDQAITAHGPVAAVCVWPRFVARAVERLAGTEVGIAAVANFPEGDADPARAVDDAVAIVEAGGTEVDLVYPWRALASGNTEVGPSLLVAVRDAIGAEVHLKVILETGELGDEDLIRRAALDAVAAGADFCKTSTGKTATSATPEAAAILADVLADRVLDGRPVGLKVSGGIRTVEDAARYLELTERRWGPGRIDAGTFRFGASGLLGDVLAALDG